MPGENATDEVISDSNKAFRINNFNIIIDTAVSTLERRFEDFNNKLYADLAWLDPRSINEIRISGLQAPTIEVLCEKLISFEPDMTAKNRVSYSKMESSSAGSVTSQSAIFYKCHPKCQDSTGKGFKELVGRTLESYNISIKQCVGTSTDGAANMQGQYDGFTA
ncbi:hypothetical protein TSAR_013113 [Trichomalopsis sarcophagae]|uniref:DUF4371 domain-containing protein n=1 Tax=Trichomalopsis sarcophagae TaxID=543379 RepID=A0A232ERE6_9HYME|nr:hypothetical protein TSAR_013113 [Trichomalopsis sarcophagae]